jgi:predicted Zn-dependent protease
MLHRLRTLFVAGLLLLGWAGCTTHPETGRSQLIMVGEQEEAQMGLQAFEEIKQQEAISDNKMAIDQVNRVGRRIAIAVGDRIPDADWEFVVFESEELNAFALPGGKVGVYTGLLALVESDDELAAVMGHEIAHVSSRHSAERMSQQMMAGLVAVGAEVYMESEDMDSDNRWLTRAALGLGTSMGYMLPYSRLHETEADIVGLKFAAAAGYDPRASYRFWQKMKAASADEARPLEFMSTHPSPDNRIARLQELAPQLMPLYEQKKAEFEELEMQPVIGEDPE